MGAATPGGSGPCCAGSEGRALVVHSYAAYSSQRALKEHPFLLSLGPAPLSFQLSLETQPVCETGDTRPAVPPSAAPTFAAARRSQRRRARPLPAAPRTAGRAEGAPERLPARPDTAGPPANSRQAPLLCPAPGALSANGGEARSGGSAPRRAVTAQPAWGGPCAARGPSRFGAPRR